MSAKTPVILYHYDASPFATKIKNALVLKKIPHKRVTVPMIMPRPELSELLGVRYRRIPILAIGNDIYCDTSLITNALERRFPASKGYGTLFPPRVGSHKADTGLAKALVVYWNDRTVFPIGGQSLPYGKLDKKFLADRAAWQGTPIDVEALSARQGYRTSALSSHLSLVEEQLADGRKWLLDTEQPGLVDSSAQFILAWMRQFKTLKEVYDPKVFPKTIDWLARMSEYLANAQKAGDGAFEQISGEEAAKEICSSAHEEESTVGFEEAEAKRLGVDLHDEVSVIPADNALIPTIGKLVALNREELVILVTSGSAGTVHCHFPRLEFKVKRVEGVASKL